MRPTCPLSRVARRALGWLPAIGLALLLVPAAEAHKASDAYLQVEERASGVDVRWDIALRDLDAALELDADGDGRLTWAEVRSAWPRIERYALDRLRITGCPLSATGRALERRNDGAYAVLQMTAPCHPKGELVIDYALLREVDPTHRGIARIRQQGRDLMVRVLDPTAPTNTEKATPLVHADEASAPRSDAVDATGPSTERASHASADGLDPALGFAKEGVRHILTGYDHVLFLLCLLLPAVMRRTPNGWRPVERLSQAVSPVVGIVSAFTVAHSITLGLAATKTVSLPPAFIEPAIAVTIVLAALDNLHPVFPVRRVVVTFCFGLVHGFGFASVLSELELPPARFAWALLQFNLGLEAGQLLIVVGVTVLLFLVRALPRYPAWAIRGGSTVAIVVGLLWFVERTANVSILGW